MAKCIMQLVENTQTTRTKENDHRFTEPKLGHYT